MLENYINAIRAIVIMNMPDVPCLTASTIDQSCPNAMSIYLPNYKKPVRRLPVGTYILAILAGTVLLPPFFLRRQKWPTCCAMLFALRTVHNAHSDSGGLTNDRRRRRRCRSGRRLDGKLGRTCEVAREAERVWRNVPVLSSS